jgi:isovaleryl-CoA dehydrogenase
MEHLLSAPLIRLRDQLTEIVERDIAPHADKTDQLARWPQHSFDALGRAGLLGLHVPVELGGLGQGMLALAVLTETIGRRCASSAMCYGMHCVGTAVIAAKATPQQNETYLRPIARGEHITTLALSEAGSGVHFYLSETDLARDGDCFQLNGTKHFITNGGHADSYVVSTKASNAAGELGEFSCLLVDKGSRGLEWLEPWHGLGMRGNSSRGLRLRDAQVPAANLLGQEGDEIWYMFEVIVPYFIMAMAGTYLGVAQAAYETAAEHLKGRAHSTSGESLASVGSNQMLLADIWARVERTRLWIHQAARLGDLGDPGALPMLITAKAEAADTAVSVTNDAMTLSGGIAYRDNSLLARLLRDARASHVMSPTTAMLRLWTGRALLGQPLL